MTFQSILSAIALFVLLVLSPFARADAALSAGVGIAAAGRYPGAADTGVFVMPYLEWRGASGMFASTVRGVGGEVMLGNFSASAALNVDPGRTQRARPFGYGAGRLSGMGDIPASLVADVELGWHNKDGVGVSAIAHLATTRRAQGNVLELRSDFPVYADSGNQVRLSVSAKLADRRHMQTWFGVQPDQHARSGYPSYTLGRGVEGQALSAEWSHGLPSDWLVSTQAGVTRLGDRAADSPLVQRRTGPFFSFGLLRQWK